MFNCPECDKGYTKQTSLTRHLQNHRKSKQFTCPTCHVSFYRRDLLSRHSKIHGSDASSTASSTMRNSNGRNLGKQGRQRCHTACVSCRESRTKCDGSQPCLSCTSSGKTCEYSRPLNRISRAPLYNRLHILESPAQRSDHEDEPSASRQEQDPIISNQESHHSQIDLDQSELNGFLLSPAVSSDAPFFTSDSSIQQCQNDLFNPSLLHGQSSPSGPNMSVSMIDPLLSDLGSDTMGWPWLHENLFLQPEYSGIWPSFDVQCLTDQDVAHNVDGPQHRFRNLDQAVIHSDSWSMPGTIHAQQRRDMPQGQAISGSSQGISSRMHVNDEQTSEYAAAEQKKIIDEVVTQATGLVSFPNTKEGRKSHWLSMSMKVRNVFALQIEQSQHSTHTLQIFIDLYLQHFAPLWPLLSRQNLDCDLLHPLLYLTLASIGAMYGGAQSAHCGTLMHCRLRQSLTTGLDFGEIDEDLVWLGQARLLTQVAALYFGQTQAFSYAQHLGGILVAQARRMNLFKAPRGQSDDYKPGSQRPASERLTRWLYLEARRRLAFGILRAETYTSVLLSTRPLVSPEEIDLELPYADSTWRGEPLPSEIFLAMVERDRASRLKQRFSDIVRIALERDEAPTALDAMGHELLLFGLQQSVWRFSHDRDILGHLMGNMELSSQLKYDGLETPSVSHQTSAYSKSAIPAAQPVEPSLCLIQEDHLWGSPRRMNDFQTDLDRLVAALQKWKESLKSIRNSISLQQDRNSVLSSLLLYHLSYVRLQAPIEDMHYISYRIADKRPLEKQIIDNLHDWANSRRATLAVQHACIIWSLIIREARRPEGTRAQFNFLAFAGLHHAAVALWTFMGANTGLESQTIWYIEPLVDSHPKIAVNQSHSRKILELFSQVANLIGPGRWSSFGAVALKLSDSQFPQSE